MCILKKSIHTSIWIIDLIMRGMSRGLTYGQALQLRRIFDLEEVFEEWIEKLGGYFIKKGI